MEDRAVIAVLSTASGVAFVGDLVQGGGHSIKPQVQSFPLSFRVGRRQYIAVETGGGSLRQMPRGLVVPYVHTSRMETAPRVCAAGLKRLRAAEGELPSGFECSVSIVGQRGTGPLVPCALAEAPVAVGVCTNPYATDRLNPVIC